MSSLVFCERSFALSSMFMRDLPCRAEWCRADLSGSRPGFAGHRPNIAHGAYALNRLPHGPFHPATKARVQRKPAGAAAGDEQERTGERNVLGEMQGLVGVAELGVQDRSRHQAEP